MNTSRFHNLTTAELFRSLFTLKEAVSDAGLPQSRFPSIGVIEGILEQRAIEVEAKLQRARQESAERVAAFKAALEKALEF